MKDNKIREAFSKIHAPEAVLREVNMRIGETPKINLEKPKGYSKVILVAAILAGILAVSVAAYGLSHSDFYKNAFGTGIEGSPGGPRDEYDRDGNYVKTVHEAAVERVEVDPKLAEELVGEKMASVGETVTIGEYTVTVNDFVFDENGIGIVSAVISHPEGHIRYNSEWYQSGYEANVSGYELFDVGDKELDYPSLGFRGKVATDESTATDYHMIYYVCPMSEEQVTDDIDYVFYFPTPLHKSLTYDQYISGEANHYSEDELYDKAKIRIHINDRVAATEFVCGEDKISISPLGAKLPLGCMELEGANENISRARYAKEFVINFKDGGEYIVNDEDHASNGEGTLDEAGGGVSRYAFNRLVDVENIESVYIMTQDGVERVYTIG
ncbi:MAG: hypothetical protein IJQ80_00705 [Clostridia bacterium]|nr:hypothetical protein [Clostridia bacterium]